MRGAGRHHDRRQRAWGIAGLGSAQPVAADCSSRHWGKCPAPAEKAANEIKTPEIANGTNVPPTLPAKLKPRKSANPRVKPGGNGGTGPSVLASAPNATPTTSDCSRR